MLREFFSASSLRTRAIAWSGASLLVAISVARALMEAAIVAWYGSFYNILHSASSTAGSDALDVGRASVSDGLLQFAKIALPWAVLAPLGSYVRRHFCFAWRMAITESYVDAWHTSDAAMPEGASQRVQEDTTRFSSGIELLAGKMLDGVLKLYIFLPKLFGTPAQPDSDNSQ